MKLTLTDYLIPAKYHTSQNSDESLGHDQALINTIYPGSKAEGTVFPHILLL